MIADGANETDVREEIAAPFLAVLGYKRGTENDILREFSLAYDRIFLGRKKPNDPPLRGRADYVLSVTGAGRWVLEIKAPSVAIDQDAIDQAISYARHPEVSATYAAVLNGIRFVVFHSSQRSSERPLVDVAVVSAEKLAGELSALLSPAAIRRDCSPSHVDLGLPLAEGFRSRAEVRGGFNSFDEFMWAANFPMPAPQHALLDEMCRRMRGMRSTIVGGSVWRDEASRIRAKLNWSAPNDDLLQFAFDKNLMNAEYLSLGVDISSSGDRPTVFDVVGGLHIAEGEKLFDPIRWDVVVSGLAMSMNYRGQAIGHIDGRVFKGRFQTEYECTFPALPGMGMGLFGTGAFEVVLDPR